MNPIASPNSTVQLVFDYFRLVNVKTEISFQEQDLYMKPQ